MQWRLFPSGAAPECTTPEWHRARESVPHLSQADHHERLMLARDYIMEARIRYAVRSVVDLGCGDGGLLSTLPPDLAAWGYDLTPANIAVGQRRGVDARYEDIVAADPEWADLVVATEVLEHLEDPTALLRRAAQRSRVLVASSPATETDRAHYEHHLWAFDLEGYRALIEGAGWRVVRHEPVSWFQVVMAICG